MINELLAPCGNLEAVKIAVLSGTDAVYCAGKRFGARAFISNLSEEEIIEAAHFVHLHGKKIYITLNTLVFEEELEEAKKYVDFLYQHVDAIIVQDYGIVHYMRTKYPDFPVHLSTQCSIHNIDDVKFLKEIGISRIVLAREVSIDEIKMIKEAGIELEIFIHGALCFSYSGMCYLSYYKGGRSGNRGNCAQPCRQNYDLLEDDEVYSSGPLLSMKDLNSIANIKELLDMGVTSLKVEGRAKSLEYLSSVIKIYRRLIDRYNSNEEINVEEEMLDDLYSSFSREITKGYLLNEENGSITTKGSVKHQGILIGKVLEYRKNQIKVKLQKPLELLDGIRIIDQDRESGLTVTRIIENGQLVKSSKGVVYIDVKHYVSPNSLVYKTSSNRVSKSLNSQEELYKQNASLNVTIKQKHQQISIKVGKIDISCDFDYELDKAKTINEENVKKQFMKTNNLPIKYEYFDYTNNDNLFIPIPTINKMRTEVLDKLKIALEINLVRQYISYPFINDNFVLEKPLDSLEIVEKDNENDLINNKPLKTETFAYHLKEIGQESIVGPYFGVANHLAVSFFRNLSRGVIVLSYESTLDNAIRLSKYDSSLGYLVNYYEPLMVSKHCVVASEHGYKAKKCGLCYKHDYKLKDGDRTYQLKFHNCIMRIVGKNIKNKSHPDLISITIK